MASSQRNPLVYLTNSLTHPALISIFDRSNPKPPLLALRHAQLRDHHQILLELDAPILDDVVIEVIGHTPRRIGPVREKRQREWIRCWVGGIEVELGTVGHAVVFVVERRVRRWVEDVVALALKPVESEGETEKSRSRGKREMIMIVKRLLGSVQRRLVSPMSKEWWGSKKRLKAYTYGCLGPVLQNPGASVHFHATPAMGDRPQSWRQGTRDDGKIHG